MSALEPFHAPILFYMDTTTDVFIYCYFCPNRNTFHTYPRNLGLTEILSAHALLNGQGYGMHVRLQYPFGIAGLPINGLGGFSACHTALNGLNQGLKDLNQALSECPATKSVQGSIAQAIFNITLVVNIGNTTGNGRLAKLYILARI